MLQYIQKRDGSVVQFQKEKIIGAIQNALIATNADESVAEQLTDKAIQIIEVSYKGGHIPSVENIQDIVELILINNGYSQTAKAYILYREKHAQLRDTKDLLKQAVNMVDNYLGEADWRVKENSNMGYSLQGLNNYISSQVTSSYWLNKIYDHSVKSAHESGELHVHDLGLLSVYCCGWDLMDLLEQGLGGVAGFDCE